MGLPPPPLPPPPPLLQVIDELESTLPRWLMRPHWYPHFVHVAKLSPRSAYEVNLNSVWTGIGNLQSSLLNAQEVRCGPYVPNVFVCACTETRM